VTKKKTTTAKTARTKKSAPTQQPQPTYIEGVDALKSSLDGLGFERIQTEHGSTFKENSTVIIIPSRDDKFHYKVVQSWQQMIAPMNAKRAILFTINDEVGVAYNNMIKGILADPNLSKWKYVMTLEGDNIQPPDAHIRLLESIDEFGLDAVSGIYFTKGDIQRPMAFGDANVFKETGVLDFRPLDIKDFMNKGRVVEVCGIAQGCSLYRMDLFRQIEPPWFVTVSDLVEGKGAMSMTQDLYFAEKAKRAGKRFGVDLRVKVGHIDLGTGIVY
jgi:hypothetical protein